MQLKKEEVKERFNQHYFDKHEFNRCYSDVEEDQLQNVGPSGFGGAAR